MSSEGDQRVAWDCSSRGDFWGVLWGCWYKHSDISQWLCKLWTYPCLGWLLMSALTAENESLLRERTWWQATSVDQVLICSGKIRWIKDGECPLVSSVYPFSIWRIIICSVVSNLVLLANLRKIKELLLFIPSCPQELVEDLYSHRRGSNGSRRDWSCWSCMRNVRIYQSRFVDIENRKSIKELTDSETHLQDLRHIALQSARLAMDVK